MGRPPCCDKSNVRRGLWTAEEDKKIVAYVSTHGAGNWASVPKKAGLKRCGKSCRLRWTNYLRPDLKHDDFTPAEEQAIISLHSKIGSRWSIIAHQLPGRTDNDVKNYWNTKLKKKLIQRGIDPVTHRPISHVVNSIQGLSRSATDDTQKNHHLAFSSLSEPSQSSTAEQESLFFGCDPHSDLLAQIHAVNLVSQNMQTPAASSSSHSITPETGGEGSFSDFSWMDSIALPLTGTSATSPLQIPGEECGGGGEVAGGDDDDLGASSLSDINSFVESLLSRDDEMIWSFPEFLDDHLYGP